MAPLTKVMKRALFSAAEGGMLHWCQVVFSRSGELRSRRPIAWVGYGTSSFGRSTIQALRARQLIYGTKGKWVFHLTRKGYLAAAAVAQERQDDDRARLWRCHA